MYDKEVIREHYKKQAEEFGDSPKSTMEEQVIRDKEMVVIKKTLVSQIIVGSANRVLDLGCGNGYALSELRKMFTDTGNWIGVDFTQEFVDIANKRNLNKCEFLQGDATNLEFKDNHFDFIYTERCLINIMSWEDQKKALDEIHRVLKPGGKFLMIECFTDGMDNNNKAREEMGLDHIGPAHHNFYFEKGKFFEHIASTFSDVDRTNENFLSTHYFVARILHPLVTKGEWKKNTEFVRFFGQMPPYGNYSPIQALILKKGI